MAHGRAAVGSDMLGPALAVAVMAVAMHKVKSASTIRRWKGHASVVVSRDGVGGCFGLAGNGRAEG